jgi:hypothetical protein
MKRRKFFGKTMTGILGGITLRNYLPSLFSRKQKTHPTDKTITVTINPLAVPRTEKGSTPHGS